MLPSSLPALPLPQPEDPPSCLPLPAHLALSVASCSSTATTHSGWHMTSSAAQPLAAATSVATICACCRCRAGGMGHGGGGGGAEAPHHVAEQGCSWGQACHGRLPSHSQTHTHDTDQPGGGPAGQRQHTCPAGSSQPELGRRCMEHPQHRQNSSCVALAESALLLFCLRWGLPHTLPARL